MTPEDVRCLLGTYAIAFLVGLTIVNLAGVFEDLRKRKRRRPGATRS